MEQKRRKQHERNFIVSPRVPSLLRLHYLPFSYSLSLSLHVRACVRAVKLISKLLTVQSFAVTRVLIIDHTWTLQTRCDCVSCLTYILTPYLNLTLKYLWATR